MPMGTSRGHCCRWAKAASMALGLTKDHQRKSCRRASVARVRCHRPPVDGQQREHHGTPSQLLHAPGKGAGLLRWPGRRHGKDERAQAEAASAWALRAARMASAPRDLSSSATCAPQAPSGEAFGLGGSGLRAVGVAIMARRCGVRASVMRVGRQRDLACWHRRCARPTLGRRDDGRRRIMQGRQQALDVVTAFGDLDGQRALAGRGQALFGIEEGADARPGPRRFRPATARMMAA
jgi:hypothetical protein